MQSARVEIPGVEDVDFYNPPDWWREKHQREIKLGFIKPEPPESLRDLFSHFNPARARASWEQICRLKDNRLLGVISSSGKDRLAEAVVVQSEDQGQSWKFLSFAARYDPKHVDQTVAHKPTELDGFCEPSIVQFPDGELLVVMRLGSHHPLYSVRSQDGGQTWTEPKRLTARSVQPKLVDDLHEAEEYGSHANKPIVRGRKQSRDHECHCPAKDLKNVIGGSLIDDHVGQRPRSPTTSLFAGRPLPGDGQSSRLAIRKRSLRPANPYPAESAYPDFSQQHCAVPVQPAYQFPTLNRALDPDLAWQRLAAAYCRNRWTLFSLDEFERDFFQRCSCSS